MVPGIWISGSYTADSSPPASGATTVDDCSTDGSSPVRKRLASRRHASESDKGKGRACAQPSAEALKTLKRYTLSEQHFSDSTTLNGEGPSTTFPTTLNGEGPSTLLPASKSEGFNCPTNMAKSKPRRRLSSTQATSDATPTVVAEPAPDPKSEPVPVGTAEVFANTRTRRTTSGFEILPAGAHGERMELHDYVQNSEEEPRTPNRLQKPRSRRPN